jgi:hypothetical protein
MPPSPPTYPSRELRGIHHPQHVGHVMLHQHDYGLIPRGGRGAARLASTSTFGTVSDERNSCVRYLARSLLAMGGSSGPAVSLSIRFLTDSCGMGGASMSHYYKKYLWYRLETYISYRL